MATGSSTDADDTFTTIVALAVAGLLGAVGTAFLVAGAYDVWAMAAGDVEPGVTVPPVPYLGEMLLSLTIGWVFVLGGVRFGTAY
ncbi:MAG: hypothetical protein ACOCQM_07475 [Natronomonas sp.]